MDGAFARGFHLEPTTFDKTVKVAGWLVNPTTVKNFVFGNIDTEGELIGRCGTEEISVRLIEDEHSTEPVAGSSADAQAHIDRACIEYHFCDGVLGAANSFRGSEAGVAGAVHPDSKLASLIGVAVKSGKPTSLPRPASFPARRAERKTGSILYVAKFLYRQASFLAALGLVPDAAPKQDEPLKTSTNGNQRKRTASVEPPRQDAAAAKAGESLQQRRDRLEAELLAVKEQRLEAEIKAIQRAINESGAAKQSDDGAVKQEEAGVTKNGAAGKSKETLKNQKIYLELSDDED